MKVLGNLHKGWMRVWIVSSILITLAVFVNIYPSEENQRTWFSSGYTRDQIRTGSDERAAIEDFFSRRHIPDGAKNCRDRAYLFPLIEDSEKSLMVVKCPRSGLEKLLNPLFVSAILCAFLFFAGLVVSWIRKGFKQQKDAG